jgi:hypothetical protein
MTHRAVQPSVSKSFITGGSILPYVGVLCHHQFRIKSKRGWKIWLFILEGAGPPLHCGHAQARISNYKNQTAKAGPVGMGNMVEVYKTPTRPLLSIRTRRNLTFSLKIQNLNFLTIVTTQEFPNLHSLHSHSPLVSFYRRCPYTASQLVST